MSADHPPQEMLAVFVAHLVARRSTEVAAGDADADQGGVVGGVATPHQAQAATQALGELLEVARAAHGHLAVDQGRFLAHLARHIPPAPEEWGAALARIHAADLYLAFACAEQVPGALAAFETTCGAAIDGALSGQATAAFADDAKQVVREKLFIGAGDPEEGGEPRILSYAGRGPLAAWVAVSAQRTALSLRRREVSEQARNRAAAPDELVGSVHPELAYLKRMYRGAFVESFEAAFAAITNRERTLLRLHLVSRLRLDQIAPMFQVNISTISRWLAGARDSLLLETREGLSRRLHLAPGEFDSLARLLQSQIDVSLVRLLADQPPPVKS